MGSLGCEITLSLWRDPDMMFLLHGTFYLYVLRTIFTGMADGANEAFVSHNMVTELVAN